MAKNSFNHPVCEVRFGTYKPEDVRPAFQDALKYASAVEKKILDIAHAERDYRNTIQALNDSTEKLDLVAGIVSHLSGVIDGVWDKSDEFVSESYAKFMAKRGLNKRIYLAVKTVYDERKKLGLTPAQQRLVKDYVVSFERSGINLPKDKQARLKKIMARIAKLRSIFDRNTTKASDKAHLVVKTAEELQGIDEELIEQWHDAAKQKGVSGYYISWSPPVAESIMTQCDVQKTRIAFSKISVTRAPNNEKLIYEILALRKEMARILGYKNFVDYVVEQRMAKSSKAIDEFNRKLYKTFKPALVKSAGELQTFIRERTGNLEYKLHSTDVSGGTPLYFAQRLAAEKFDIDENEVREYFPLEKVVKVMFDTLSTIYGIKIVPSKEPLPHKSTQTYRIYDEKGRHLSTVWCDWLARKGKRSGAWCNTFYEAQRGGVYDKPHLGLVCANFKPPTKTKPSLLSIRDVETAWHEFGHFMHVTLSDTELREQGGFHAKWDFIEAPSQIMENWVWNELVLAKMTSHYKTKKPMPKDMIRKLISSRAFWAAERVMWTLHWSDVDQALHTRYDPAKDGNILQYYRKLKGKYFAAEIPPYDKRICTFTHIFAGGYYGAYYGYQWAEVIEADLFSRFEKEGPLNPKTGRDYRDKVLARGNEADPDILIRDFLGRDVTPKALLKRSGI